MCESKIAGANAPSGSFRDTADQVLSNRHGEANVDYMMQQKMKAQALSIISKLSKIDNMRSVFIVTQEHDMNIGMFITKEYGPYSIMDLVKHSHLLLRSDMNGFRVICQ